MVRHWPSYCNRECLRGIRNSSTGRYRSFLYSARAAPGSSPGYIVGHPPRHMATEVPETSPRSAGGDDLGPEWTLGAAGDDADRPLTGATGDATAAVTFGAVEHRPRYAYTAELGLLESLQRPRNYHKKAVAGKTLNSISLPTGEDGETVDAAALASLRTDKAAEGKRVRAAEVDEVKSLHHQGIKPAEPAGGLAGLKRVASKRKARHDETVEAYRDDRKAMYAKVEDNVLAASTRIKEELETADERIAAIFTRLNDDDDLVQRSIEYVHESWGDIEAACRSRTERIDAFATALERLEDERADSVGARLRAMVKALVDIAHELPPTIERLAEQEAYEVNLVTISNRRDYADLVSRLRRDDVKVFHASRRRWELRLKAWRLLKHNRALETYKNLLNGETYTNPPSRAEKLRELQALQRKRHEERRLPLLKSLRTMVPPQLSSQKVEELKHQFEELDTLEQSQNADKFREAEASQTASTEEARAELERLRSEIHNYAALAPEGEFKRLQAALDPLVASQDLEDFFVRAGGLKAELSAIIACLGQPTLIYDAELESLRRRTAFLVSSLGIEAVLEAQGKSSDRKALMDTLERMRSAKRTDIPPLLPKLKKQVMAFGGTSGLNRAVREEMTDAVSTLEGIIEEYRAAGGTVGPGSTVAGSTVAGSTRGGTTRGAPTRGAPTRGTLTKGTRSRTTKGKASTKKTRRGTSTRRGSGASLASGSSSTGPSAAINMMEVRSVQRRIGSVAYADLLPEAIQVILREVLEACELQHTSNRVVDAVLARECAPLVEQREAEGRALLRRVGLSLEAQAVRLASCCEKVCVHFIAIANKDEAQAVLEDDTDERYKDELDGALDDYEDEDDELEAKLEKALKKLRHAEDAVALERNMENALNVLQEIEDHYRRYHSRATSLAAEHPVAVAQNLRRYRKSLCLSFGLIFPTADEDDGISVVEEEPAPEDGVEEAKSAVDGDGAADDDAAEAKGAESVAAADADEKVAEAGFAGGDDESQEGKTPAAEEEDDEVHLDSLEVWETTNGTTYRVKRSPEDWAELLLTVSDDEDSDEEPDVNERRASQLQDGIQDADALEGGSEAPDDAADAEAAAGDQSGGEEGKDGEGKEGSTDGKSAVEEEPPKIDEPVDEFGMPVDPAGERCVVYLEVPRDEVSGIVSEFRSTFFERWDEYIAKRRADVQALYEERATSLTEEVEERLRRHWPRKGHAEVKVKQPREGELISHRQKFERHVRKMLERNAKHDAEFDKIVVEAHEAVKTYNAKAAALAKALPSRTNLAALQGVQQKMKVRRQEFRVACEAWHERAQLYTREEPNRLLLNNAEFLRSCRLFAEGGEYARAEVAIAKRGLADLESKLEASVERRNNDVDGVVGEQQASMDSFADFKRQFDDALQDLSMREGLGQKYGGPRRNAQERMRTQVAWSDAAAAAIDDDLNKLEEVAALVPGSQDDHSDGPISERIVTIISNLRTSTHARARFLQAFVEDLREFDLQPVVLTDLPPSSEEGTKDEFDEPEPEREMTEEEKAAEARAAAGTFMGAVDELVQKCGEETRALYESEGKPLEEGQLPPSLEAYLAEQKEKASDFRESSSRQFREQIDRLQTLLLSAPVTAVKDVTARAIATADGAASRLEKSFAAEHRALEQAKAKHKSELKPQLSDPNEADALASLSSRETERCADVRAAVARARDAVLNKRVQCSADGIARLQHVSDVLLKLLDTSIIRNDLAALPGDELIVPQRMSLKRMQKTMRKHGKEVDDVLAEGKEPEVGPQQVLRKREWTGLPEGQFVLPEAAEWLLDERAKAGAAAGAGGDGEGDADATEAAGGAGAADGDVAEEGGPKRGPSTTSYYSPAARKVVRTRDSCFNEYLAHFKDTTSAFDARCSRLYDAEGLWEANWKKMVGLLASSA